MFMSFQDDFELFGNELRHGAGDVLTHIGLADRDPHFAVGADGDPNARLGIGGRCGQRFADLGRRITDHEAGRGGSDNEAAPIDGRQSFDLLMLCHGLHPPHLGRRAQDCALDSHVAHAAAEIAVHVRDDFGLGGICVLREQ